MVTVTSKFALRHVVAVGIVAGLIFAVFEMVAAAVLMGSQAFFMPLRMISGIVLGAGALDPGYSLIVAGITGVLVHMVLSIGFALLFAAVVSPTSTETTLTLAGIAFGTVLWVLNFYAIAPVVGWTWFPEQTNPIVQFIAHAFFFGCVVGWGLARSRTITVRPVP